MATTAVVAKPDDSGWRVLHLSDGSKRLQFRHGADWLTLPDVAAYSERVAPSPVSTLTVEVTLCGGLAHAYERVGTG